MTVKKSDLKALNANERINWFPGHMHKSLQKLQTLQKNVDLIIFVGDARAKKASKSEEIYETFSNKPILEIYLKKDLNDCSKFSNDNLEINLLDNKIKKVLVEKINEKLKEKINKLKKKGLVKPLIQVVVCGLPNIGKSTLINKLVQKNVASAADTPGFTKAFNRYLFHENMWIYDTPGIFYKKVQSDEIGYQLALIGCIKREILPLKKTLEFAYKYLQNHYPQYLEKVVSQSSENLDDFLEKVAQKYNFIKKEGNYDFEKASWYFFDLIRTGKIGTISWDLDLLKK